jgi:hypothetical protein
MHSSRPTNSASAAFFPLTPHAAARALAQHVQVRGASLFGVDISPLTVQDLVASGRRVLAYLDSQVGAPALHAHAAAAARKRRLLHARTGCCMHTPAAACKRRLLHGRAGCCMQSLQRDLLARA